MEVVTQFEKKRALAVPRSSGQRTRDGETSTRPHRISAIGFADTSGRPFLGGQFLISSFIQSDALRYRTGCGVDGADLILFRVEANGREKACSGYSSRQFF